MSGTWWTRRQTNPGSMALANLYLGELFTTIRKLLTLILSIRHILLRIEGGYVAINCYHHAAGDGTSGILMINSILSNYDILYNGGSLDRKSNKPLPSIEELTSSVKNNQVLKSLVDSKIERAQTYRPRLPFSLTELEENNGAEIPLNKSIFTTGTEDNYQATRSVEFR